MTSIHFKHHEQICLQEVHTDLNGWMLAPKLQLLTTFTQKFMHEMQHAYVTITTTAMKATWCCDMSSESQSGTHVTRNLLAELMISLLLTMPPPSLASHKYSNMYFLLAGCKNSIAE